MPERPSSSTRVKKQVVSFDFKLPRLVNTWNMFVLDYSILEKLNDFVMFW